MGWLFGWRSRAALVKHLTDENGLETLAHKTTTEQGQSVLWAVHKVSQTYSEPELRGMPFIACYLLDGHGDGPQSHGYKDMSEEMHPYFYSCPLHFLVLAPKVQCQPWRDGVEQYHKESRDREVFIRCLRVGDTVKLREGCKPAELQIVSTKPLVGMYEGTRYKIAPRYIVCA